MEASQADTLLAMAEIAIGLAGFSAIVVIFKRRGSGRWRREDADRFNGMVLHAMTAVFFCALPWLVGAFARDSRTLWAIASALLGVQTVWHAAVVAWLSSTRPIAAGVVLTGGLAAASLQLANVLGVLGFAREFAPYVVGVLWHLGQAGALFVMLIWVRDADVGDT